MSRNDRALSEDDGIYMVLLGGGAPVFVKELNFFRGQGGFSENWGRNWIPVRASSIEGAREKGCKMLDETRPYRNQVKL